MDMELVLRANSASTTQQPCDLFQDTQSYLEPLTVKWACSDYITEPLYRWNEVMDVQVCCRLASVIESLSLSVVEVRNVQSCRKFL